MSPSPLFIQLIMLRRISWPGPFCLHERLCLPANQGENAIVCVEEDYGLHSAAYCRERWNRSLSEILPLAYDKRKQMSRQVTKKPAQAVVCFCKPVKPHCSIYQRTDGPNPRETLRAVAGAPGPPRCIS